MVGFKMYLERRIQEMKLPNMTPRFGANLMVDSVAINLDREKQWKHVGIIARKTPFSIINKLTKSLAWVY